jgi:hypothetical protein
MIITDSSNVSSTGKIFTISFLNHFSSLALILYLFSCRGNFGEPNRGEFFSSA